MEGARNERCHKWAHKYLKALKTYTKHTERKGEKKDRGRQHSECHRATFKFYCRSQLSSKHGNLCKTLMSPRLVYSLTPSLTQRVNKNSNWFLIAFGNRTYSNLPTVCGHPKRSNTLKRHKMSLSSRWTPPVYIDVDATCGCVLIEELKTRICVNYFVHKFAQFMALQVRQREGDRAGERVWVGCICFALCQQGLCVVVGNGEEGGQHLLTTIWQSSNFMLLFMSFDRVLRRVVWAYFYGASGAIVKYLMCLCSILIYCR